jgi:hypothetical protein
VDEPIESIEEDALPEEHGAYEVTLPSGAKAHVMTEEERDYVADRAVRYTSEYAFSSISDLQDVDRVLMMELVEWRYNRFLTHGIDYNGEFIVQEEIQKSILDISKELRQVKKLLGIDKAAREKLKGESVSDYLDSLRFRAKKFGIMREQQLTKSISLFKELQSLITYHDNCTEVERRENGVTIEDIISWLRDTAFTEFDEIDEHFLKNEQSLWVREM